MVSKYTTNFCKSNKIKFKRLENNYRCKIIIIEINDNIFKAIKKNRHPIPTYYRLLLARLLPFLNRIIYLDGDTITLTDLSEMINLNMKNNIMMGFIDDSYDYAKFFGIKTYKYINVGVLLINLLAMKNENITYKFFEFMINNRKYLIQEDQTIINIVLHERLGILPPKYGMWSFSNISDLLKHNNYNNYSLGLKCYNETEIIKSYKNPSIIHFVQIKPHLLNNYNLNLSYINYWLYYSKKAKLLNN